eukprot:957480-Pyramimonas_sp.AAC.1
MPDGYFFFFEEILLLLFSWVRPPLFPRAPLSVTPFRCRVLLGAARGGKGGLKHAGQHRAGLVLFRPDDARAWADRLVLPCAVPLRGAMLDFDIYEARRAAEDIQP